MGRVVSQVAQTGPNEVTEILGTAPDNIRRRGARFRESSQMERFDADTAFNDVGGRAESMPRDLLWRRPLRRPELGVPTRTLPCSAVLLHRPVLYPRTGVLAAHVAQ